MDELSVLGRAKYAGRMAACGVISAALAVSLAPSFAYAVQNQDADQGAISTQAADEEYTYVYAGLSWAEYWANEGVYNANNAESSDAQDQNQEYDKGGYDVVTRATTNHGLHRGSYQCNATIHAKANDGTEKDFAVSVWADDGKSFTTTDGATVAYSKGKCTVGGVAYTLTSYDVYGTKYVPVKVKTSDYDAFKSNREAAGYTVVEDGGTLTGGYSEINLKAYKVKADIDSTTYGLKTATKEADGSFSFSASDCNAAQTGSGIEGQDLKEATGIETIVKTGAGSYGELIRVDLGGDYGDLGANMQSVTWTYYGDDDTYTDAKRTFGTKFAADNWMHKSNNIQLGLTESKRFELPENSDGTGYWSLTVHALGYKDYTTQFQITEDNIADQSLASEETKAELQALIEKAGALNESDYSSYSWSNLSTELQESKDILSRTYIYTATVDEQCGHLQEAIDGLVAKGAVPEEGDYILLNIPYSEFYAAETTGNKTSVDVFTSATYNKVRTGNLAGGSYHKDSSGEKILGITYPVKVTKSAANMDWTKYTRVTDDSSVDVTVTNRGKTSTTTYKGKDALFESDTYSYYILGSEQPTNYKELTVNRGAFSFSAVQGAEATSLTDSSYGFSTESSYGDYELDLSDSVKTAMAKDGADATIYGAVINTEEGESFGLRHLENIWLTTKLGWCSTTLIPAVHNCPTSYEHYVDLMGKNITSVTYYTSNGVYQVNLNEKVYVPKKSSDQKLSVSAEADASTATIEASLPFENATYEVDGNEVTVENNQFSIAGLTVGEHTVVASDPTNIYANVSATFTVSTAKAIATVSDNKVVKAEGASDEEFASFLGSIKTVSVNGKKYSASDRGSVTIVKSDGTIDLDAASNGTKVFNGYGDFAVEIASTGYSTVSGKVTIAKAASSISIPAQSTTYNGKAQAYSGKVTKSGSTGAVTFKYYSDSACTKEISAPTNAGTYYVKATVAADDSNAAATSDAAKFTIAKASNPVTAKAAKTKTVKAKKLKKAKQSVTKTITVKKAQGKVTYAKKSGDKKLSISKSGKVTVKKGTKKGTYKMKVKVKAAGNANYNAATKTVTIKVKVK